MEADERKAVARADKVLGKALPMKAEAEAIIHPIRERCKKRMQRANRNGPCKQDENNGTSD